MTKRYFLLSISAIIFICYGCATVPKSIPVEFFNKDIEMSVGVTKCPEKPQFMDSGSGGIVGLVVAAGRSSEMRTKMEGIKGSTLKELIRQSITNKLEKHFEIVNTQAILSAEIDIHIWGWFLPTTSFGIKTGSYQFRISGSLTVFENKNGKKEVLAKTSVVVNQPMGNDPTKDITQEAMLKAIEDFNNKIISEILRDAKP